MPILHRKFNCSTLLGLLSLALISSNVRADDAPRKHFLSIPKGFYIGAFGGGGHSSNNETNQTGTAFFSAAAGGPLAVHAHGESGGGAAIGGLHIGYQWSGWQFGNDDHVWGLAPAAELEGYYLNGTQVGHLPNPNPRVPEHSFVDSLPMNTGVFLANAVFNFKSLCTNEIYPYIGIGVGTAVISINGADSSQTRPAEPGINHFNSNLDASSWVFAAQAKAGLSFKMTDNWRLFGEYRMLYLASTNYTFGSTVYPTHVPTTKWNVNVGSMIYNMGDVGIEYAV